MSINNDYLSCLAAIDKTLKANDKLTTLFGNSQLIHSCCSVDGFTKSNDSERFSTSALKFSKSC